MERSMKCHHHSNLGRGIHLLDVWGHLDVPVFAVKRVKEGHLYIKSPGFPVHLFDRG